MIDFGVPLPDNLPLFTGISQEKRKAMLACLGARVRTVRKGEFLVLAQDEVNYIGIVLSGEVHMIHEDRWGDKAVLAIIRNGGLFGETFVCGTILQSIVTFQAVKNTQFLVLPFQKVLHICTNACPFHFQLIENMLRLMADKNAQLLTKLEIVSKKKLRKKLLTYFSFQSEQAGSQTFTIPLTRTQLADYLCADRTAVARELAHMKDEGLIEIDQQRVTLY
ncbi:Crp/Fnr family transcriptional regulator [uncultured Megasphaera sp.]|uniref:Crp/Fnr family transcriptional regulator n=1 Tax=uncultured Megasphaera sp. TaxID=165188 RepID=UPI0026DB51EB|nr:Crp/Fnr family transcriptional regulator [uncultured Megasphaera sp.]